MFTVGLTGGIASGKSYACSLFEAHGVEVVDADLIAHEVVQPGKPALAAIAEHFGPEFIADDGNLDRTKMRSHVFSDPAKRLELEGILHPLIRREMFSQAEAASSDYVVLAVPLLVEGGLYQEVHRVVVVDVPVEVQIERLRRRDGSSDEQIKQILASQASREERLAVADDVLDNSGTKAMLVPQVDRLHELYRKLAVSQNR